VGGTDYWLLMTDYLHRKQPHSRQRSIHGGTKCIESAGHHIGGGHSVQANMMLNDEVVPAMAKAYETAAGRAVAERIVEQGVR